MLNIIFYAFILITIIQIVYFAGVFGKFAFAKPQAATPKRIPVSVIVCAKNEAEKMRTLVPLLADQNYPDFELVLINNASGDDTQDLFEDFEKQYPNIRIVEVENNEAFWGNKKFALTMGIKAAKKEYLLFTDAECYPAGDNWIAQMSSHFTMSKTIIIGYGGFEKVKNSFLNKIIRFDSVLTAVQYFSWAKLGHPFMGTGRNMAYKKEEFFKVNGYIDHMNLHSGEDDLFINQAATKKNTTISYNPESFTTGEPVSSYTKWFAEKRKQVFTSSFYKTFDKLQLRLFFFSQAAFFALAIALLILQFNWVIIVPIIAFRYTISWIVLGYAAAKLKEKDVVYWYPVIEIILIFTQLNVFFTNMFSKPVHWK